jgi:aspartate-semialdehyde dehydrogenase
MERIKVGVIGGTGMVGQHFIKFLQNHPWFEITWLGASDRSTVGRNARVLERLGLVRLAAALDQREAAVSLTEKGAETLRLARPMWEDAQLRIEAALGAGGAETLRALAATL